MDGYNRNPVSYTHLVDLVQTVSLGFGQVSDNEDTLTEDTVAKTAKHGTG